MRILLLANNRVAVQVAAWLRGQGDAIAGLVLHPPARRMCGAEILAAAGIDERCAIDGSKLDDPAVIERVRALRADIGVSVSFGYILRKPFLDVFPRGCINLHPAHLPYNRGAYPNVWSIIDGTPAGVTLHYIDEGVDTGDIIARREVPIEPVDTGATLYRRLEETSLELFRETWPAIREGSAPRTPQPADAGSLHRRRDVDALDEIDLDRPYTARRLIDLIRARTFPPHTGAWFRAGGRRVHLELKLEYEDTAEQPNA